MGLSSGRSRTCYASNNACKKGFPVSKKKDRVSRVSLLRREGTHTQSTRCRWSRTPRGYARSGMTYGGQEEEMIFGSRSKHNPRAGRIPATCSGCFLWYQFNSTTRTGGASSADESLTGIERINEWMVKRATGGTRTKSIV